MDKNKLNQKIFENTLGTCEYVSGYENSQSILTLHCLIHDLTFQTKYQNVNRTNRKHHVCPECQKEDLKKQSAKIECECAYCHKKFLRVPSKLDNKSELYFCCREHKDLAQKIQSGSVFQKMRPWHYGNRYSDYRKQAFLKYPHKCAVCGWDEDEDCLEVHHIDENRQNGDLSNLIILCPMCHKKLTTHKYILINRSEIISKGNTL